MFKSTNSLFPFLVILFLALAVLGFQNKSISSVPSPSANIGENSRENYAAVVDSLAQSRARRSYFWVEDDSDKVTIVENKNLRRTLEDYRHKVHAAEKQREERYRVQYEGRREEYGEKENVQGHTPLFVPNLFG